MSNTFTIKSGKTLPVLRAAIDESGLVAQGLSTATAQLVMRRVDGESPPVTLSADIYDAVKGIVQHQWAAGETLVTGVYQAYWKISYPGGKVAAFPSAGYFLINVEDAF